MDCSKSSFEMFRSDSDDLFGLVEEQNLKSKISIFSLAEVLPMVCDLYFYDLFKDSQESGLQTQAILFLKSMSENSDPT